MMDRLAPVRFPNDVSYLVGRAVPAVELESVDHSRIDLSSLTGTTVIFMQPGSSSAITPVDGWVDTIKKIPGAAGCTGQCKAFQSAREAFEEIGVRVVGMSGQTPDELSAVRQQLGISYDLVSDAKAAFLSALGLRQVSYAAPDGNGSKMYHPRLLLVVTDGRIVRATVPDLTPEGASGSAGNLLEEVKTLL